MPQHTPTTCVIHRKGRQIRRGRAACCICTWGDILAYIYIPHTLFLGPAQTTTRQHTHRQDTETNRTQPDPGRMHGVDVHCTLWQTHPHKMHPNPPQTALAGSRRLPATCLAMKCDACITHLPCVMPAAAATWPYHHTPSAQCAMPKV